MILDIVVILDRSGSMMLARDDHEGGLRSFITDQRAVEGDVRLTLVQFDTAEPCDVVFDRVPIGQVPLDRVALIPRGGTPLYGAIGMALAHWEKAQVAEPADQTLVMIITDGENTDYHPEWNRDRVRERIRKLEAANKATFLYLGANVDAFEEGAGLGVGNAINYMNNTASVGAAYAVTSHKLARSRGILRSAEEQAIEQGGSFTVSMAAPMMAAGMAFTAEEQSAIVSGDQSKTGQKEEA